MFKKIKSLFVIEETPKQTEDPVAESQQEPVTQAPATATERIKPDKESFDKFIQVLSDAITAKNLQGYDYLEFKEAVSSLQNMEPDEPKRYLTAFTLAKTLGVDKKSLIDSASGYLGILKAEHDKFNAAVSKQREDRIKSRNTDLARIEQELKAKEQQIRELLTQVESMKKTREQIKLEIEEAGRKVDQVQASFSTAYTTIVAQIQKDVEKMNNYLN